MKGYNLDQIEQSITVPWTPVDIVKFNGQVLRAAVFEGEYHWHTHDNEDEFFLVHRGSIVIETDNGVIRLSEGQGTVVPKGLRHRPIAQTRAFVLMIEPEALKSQGD